jgi:hypothetical protein
MRFVVLLSLNEKNSILQKKKLAKYLMLFLTAKGFE